MPTTAHPFDDSDAPSGGSTYAGQVAILDELELKADLTETQPVRVASPTFDSGLVTLTDTLAVLTALTIEASRLILANLTTDEQAVTVTDTSGQKLLNAFQLQGNMTVPFDLGRATMVGVKWHAGANAAVNAQLVGELA